jgi:site-specific DNA recombinase
MSKIATKHCAIYTRKSSEEGLEQEFNSLDAQREACEAYIISQKHEGWTTLPDYYDDGGFSGGTMERPSLQRLLADIALGKIDTVVVYKVDRLTRALNDFARIVDAFDDEGVSFVSVTQQFNTTSSMGRLTLNVLLSFAQFEREVTGERIRDKIAASKKKGMWMGGFVPLGYEAQDRKLHIVEDEAEIIRELFQLYLNLGTGTAVKNEADRRGYRTKRREKVPGRWQGGIPIYLGHLYHLLANPIYAGYIPHKGELYEGQHDAIIDLKTWEAVQKQLASRARRKQVRGTAKHPSLLAGLIKDGEGAPFTPTHANKKGKRYRYYASRDIIRHGIKERGWRIPAAEIESAVTLSFAGFLRDETRLTDELSLAGAAETRSVIAAASNLAETIGRQLLVNLDMLVIVKENSLTISFDRAKLCEASNLDLIGSDDKEPRITIDFPMQIRKRGIEMKLVIGGHEMDQPDATLIKAIARGRAWFDEMVNGEVASISELSRREGLNMRYITQQIELAFLSPTIVEAILQGRQRVDLTFESLKRVGDLPLSWADQGRRLGVN